MQQAFLPLYTPQLYGRLGNVINVDLGGVETELSDVQQAVGALPPKIDAVTTAVGTQATALADIKTAVVADVPQSITTLGTALSTSQADLKTHFDTALKAATAEIVAQVGRPPSTRGFEVSKTAAPLIRLLIQVEALALDQTPGEPYKGPEKDYKGMTKEAVALVHLSHAAKQEAVVLANNGALLERFSKAFDDFSSNDLPSRSRRFVETHVLIIAVAEFLAHA